MKIVAHRGYWKLHSEKNSILALRSAYEKGFGIETDIRDYEGQLVICHDLPDGNEIKLSDFIDELARSKNTQSPMPLMLNIKSDGLVNLVKKAKIFINKMETYVFDMSVPDTRSYIMEGIPFFARWSEVEPSVAWLDNCQGIWLDSFNAEWYEVQDILSILDRSLKLCVVSPELHGRDHKKIWSMLHPLKYHQDLFLCTDLPDEAQEFFL